MSIKPQPVVIGPSPNYGQRATWDGGPFPATMPPSNLAHDSPIRVAGLTSSRPQDSFWTATLDAAVPCRLFSLLAHNLSPSASVRWLISDAVPPPDLQELATTGVYASSNLRPGAPPTGQPDQPTEWLIVDNNGQPTSVTFSMDQPLSDLQPGADLQIFRFAVRQSVSSAPPVDPRVTVTLFESDDQRAVLGTFPVKAPSASFDVVEVQWPAEALDELAGSGVQLQLSATSSGAASVEFGPAQWVAARSGNYTDSGLLPIADSTYMDPLFGDAAIDDLPTADQQHAFWLLAEHQPVRFVRIEVRDLGRSELITAGVAPFGPAFQPTSSGLSVGDDFGTEDLSDRDLTAAGVEYGPLGPSQRRFTLTLPDLLPEEAESLLYHLRRTGQHRPWLILPWPHLLDVEPMPFAARNWSTWGSIRARARLSSTSGRRTVSLGVTERIA